MYIVCVETFHSLTLNIASLNLENYFAGRMMHHHTKSKLLFYMGFSINLWTNCREFLSEFSTIYSCYFQNLRYCIKAKKKPSTNDNIDMTDFYDDDYDLDDDDDYGDEDEEAAEDTDDSGNGN